MSEKATLLEQINEKKGQLSHARRESESWNSGRTQTFGINQASKQRTNALEKEINELYEKVRKLGK
jgi:hypothetical protein